jgi:excisionase family DNA binding protein
MSETLLTKKDAAERLKVSVRTIDRLRAREELRFVTVGRQVRFRMADLDTFITKQTQGL